VRPVNRPGTILTLDINQRSGSPEVHLAVDAIMHGIIFQLTEAVSTGGLRFSSSERCYSWCWRPPSVRGSRASHCAKKRPQRGGATEAV